MQRLVFYLLLGLFLVSASSVTKAYGQAATPGESVPASSASTTSDQDRLQKLEQAVADAKSSGDNAWMLDQRRARSHDDRPGSGVVLRWARAQEERPGHDDAELRAHGRRHSALGFLQLQLVLLARKQFYRQAFNNIFLNGVGAAPDADYAATIPAQTFMVYQLMFAIITPGLIAGAFAERMKFSAMLMFTVLMVHYRLRSNGAHGLGQRRTAERISRRILSYPRLCGWNGRTHHVRDFSAGVRDFLGKRVGFQRTDAAA